MAISIANNLLANTAQLNLSKNQSMMQSSVAKLSSGLRINNAADDPSGLAIAEKLQSQVNGFDQAVSNIQDATNAATVAEGALQTTTDILQRIRSLAVEASSDTKTAADKGNLQAEVKQLLQEVNKISQNTNFNGAGLLDGSHAGFQAQVVAFTTVSSNTSLASAGTTAATATLNPGLLVANVNTTAPNFSTTAGGIQGVTTGGTGTLDGTIQLSVINTGASIAVQISFIPSDSSTINASVSTTLLAAGSTATTFDNVAITLGNFQTADVGTSSYIKVSQNVAAASNPSAAAFNFQTGATEGSTIALGIAATNASTLRIANINLLASAPNGAAPSLGAEDAIGQIDNALVTLLTQRANLGAVMVRLNEDSSNDATASTNLQASESNIRDLNVGKESTQYTKTQILVTIGTSVLSQSNQNAQSVQRLFQ
jgi:flagellin